METIYVILKSMFIFLGIITIVIGKYLSDKFIISKQTKYKIIDEQKYIKSCRVIFYCIGLYYILFGIVLLIINGWPVFAIYTTMIPALIVILLSLN
ncbi:MAG: hypothetical protein PHF63_12505 [Herbinix sp.]|nr:hypothetical protein [Herbinix sp.]